MFIYIRPDSNNPYITPDTHCQLMAMEELKFIDVVRNAQKERAIHTQPINFLINQV